MLVKRGQTDQTIFLNMPKDTRYYNPGEGIGYTDNPRYLEQGKLKVPSLYDSNYLNSTDAYSIIS